MKRVLEAMLSGVCVYVAMAACSASSGEERMVGSGGERNDTDGPSENNDGGFGGLLDPVPDAGASSGGADSNDSGDGDGDQEASCTCPDPEPYEPPEPTVVTLDCPSSGAVVKYEIPGKSAIELIGVRYLFEPNAGSQVKDFAMTGPVHVADGEVATPCYGPTIKFIIPGELGI
jgi:hypothetical protein